MSNPVDDHIKNWWKTFSAQAPKIDALFKGKEEWDIAAWMISLLDPIHPHLMWEFGPAVQGTGHRLVITPESRHDLRPLARAVLDQAPQLDGWEFYEYRLPEDFADAERTIHGRTGQKINDVSVQASVGEFHRIDLRFACDRYSADDPDAVNCAFSMAEALLGEEVLNQWIGAIEVSQEPDSEHGDATPIHNLRDRVAECIEDVHESLPDHPYCQLDLEEGWSSFELEPDEAESYPDQQDLIVGISPIAQMWVNALSGIPFYSGRFSRWGETFCYVKIYGTNGLEGSNFEDRGEIEDALNERLRGTGLGCVVGGGTGIKHSYIELALTDVDAAWNEIRDTLRTGNSPNRTWLQFHDDDLSTTWMGLWNDTPAPTMQDGAVSYRSDSPID